MHGDYNLVRDHILRTGETLIGGKGFTAVGLTELLAAAGVPKGSFYHYFKSKELFGKALLEHYFTNYLAEIDALLEQDATPAGTRLMRYWAGWRQTQTSACSAGKCLAVKLSGEVSDLSEEMRQALHSGMDRVVARLAACIGEGKADGSIRSDRPAERLAQQLYQMWLGASLVAKVRHDGSPFDAAQQATCDMLGLPPIPEK